MTTGPVSPPSVTVVICAYTEIRWELLCAAVGSVQSQTLPPREIILSIDHNPTLFERCRNRWPAERRPPATGGAAVRVVQNCYRGRLGSARTTAAQLATGDYLAFLDDDAMAEPDWLARMIGHFEDPAVIAVGGAPHPVFATGRPRWFPREFDWVFGCVYVGLPVTTAPVLHLIGAAMAVRRQNLSAIGYFHSDNHDDMDMCHRLRDQFPGTKVVFDPDAIVHHHVPGNRLRWSYFWQRCFFVNRGKVAAFKEMGGARTLDAERRFARQILTDGIWTGLREAVRGDTGGVLRTGALCAGLTLAILGYLTGLSEWTVSHQLGRLRGRKAEHRCAVCEAAMLTDG